MDGADSSASVQFRKRIQGFQRAWRSGGDEFWFFSAYANAAFGRPRTISVRVTSGAAGELGVSIQNEWNPREGKKRKERWDSWLSPAPTHKHATQPKVLFFGAPLRERRGSKNMLEYKIKSWKTNIYHRCNWWMKLWQGCLHWSMAGCCWALLEGQAQRSHHTASADLHKGERTRKKNIHPTVDSDRWHTVRQWANSESSKRSPQSAIPLWTSDDEKKSDSTCLRRRVETADRWW